MEDKNMIRRVMAWILLVGFIFLLLNIVMFQYYLEASILVYLIIAVWFIFTNKPLPSRKKKKAAKNSTEEDTEEFTEEFTEESIGEYPILERTEQSLEEDPTEQSLGEDPTGETTAQSSKEPTEGK
jgi:Ca2+/Na+ antiporter